MVNISSLPVQTEAAFASKEPSLAESLLSGLGVVQSVDVAHKGLSGNVANRNILIISFKELTFRF